MFVIKMLKMDFDMIDFDFVVIVLNFFKVKFVVCRLWY